MLFRRIKTDHFVFNDIENDPTLWIESHVEGVCRFLNAIVDEHEKINSGGYPQSFFKNITKIEDFSKTMQSYVDEIRWQKCPFFGLWFYSISNFGLKYGRTFQIILMFNRIFEIGHIHAVTIRTQLRATEAQIIYSYSGDRRALDNRWFY